MAKTVKKTFHIYAKIAIETSIEIKANSLDEALADSKSLKISDYIEFMGEHCDSEMRVTGVYEQHKSLEI